MRDKLVLIDGHSILNRAFYGVPDFTNSEGTHTNAIFGFLNILFKIIDEENPKYLCVAFDVHQPTFRHEMYKEYKGTRKPMLPELKQQVPLMKEMLKALNIKTTELAGFEADDILGTLSKAGEEQGLEVSVISGDRDLLQLATEHVKIRIPKTKKGKTEIEDYNVTQVLEKYSVTPKEFIDVKALMGDSSDNIPGVPGIGEKGATTIISEYGSIENAFEHADDIKNKRNREALKEHFDMAQMSKTLATINTSVPVEVKISDCVLEDMFNKEALAMVKKFEFKSMISKFDSISTENTFEENFKLMEDFGEVENLLSEIQKLKKVGLFIDLNNDEIRGISITISDDETYYIPVSGFITGEYLKEKLNYIVSNAVEVSVNDIKSNLRFVETETENKLFDAGIAAYLLNPLKSTYEYDDIARDYLEFEVPAYDEIFANYKKDKSVLENIDNISKYASYNSYVLYKSIEPLKEKLENEGMIDLYEKIEVPLTYALYDMEKTGIKVEADSLKEYGDKLAESIKTLEEEIYKEAGHEFKINSPKQLGEILFNEMGLPGGKKTKTGYSTSADVLEKLKPDYPFVEKILSYRQVTKLKSTYADGLAGFIEEDGRIHGKFNQTITATGRISSTDPNLQNIPVRTALGREVRKVFVPKEGCVFVDADYSQIELRILAHMSDDENLINAYKEAKDIHQSTASLVFNVPLDEVTKEQRSNAKAVNFGIVYGISSFGLSQDLSISRKEADKYIKDYFVSYPGVKKYLDDAVESAKEKGYSVTLFGRRRPIPELKSGNFMQKSFGERVAMNAPIQGTAADIMKIAMINVDKALKEQNLKSKIVLQVHDELLVEAYKDEVEQVKQILVDNMKNAADLRVALEVEVEVGNNWNEAH